MIVSKDLKDWTVSNLFLVPLLKIGRGRLDSLGFINSFLYNAEDPDVYPSNTIHLLFQPLKMEKFNDFVLDERDSGKDVIAEKDYLGGYIIVTYGLPKAYKKDYDLVWQGRYSETSEEYQLNIPSIVRYTTEKGKAVTDMTLQHMIFTKYANLRRHWEEEFNVQMDEDQELWTKPTVAKETFKLSDYECVTNSIGDIGEDSY